MHSGIINIGECAFGGCSSLPDIIIPSSVISIGGGAFSECSSLTSVTIPEGVTNISGNMFGDCSSLKSITIPDTVTNIDEYAFGNCTALKTVNLGYGVESIGNYAFYNCSSLKSITIPKRIKSIGYSFDLCDALTDVYYGGDEWDRENIDIYDPYLPNATWHYNSENSEDEDMEILGLIVSDNTVTVEFGGEIQSGDCVMVAVYSLRGEFLGIESAITYEDEYEYTFDIDIPENARVKAFLWAGSNDDEEAFYTTLIPRCSAYEMLVGIQE